MKAAAILALLLAATPLSAAERWPSADTPKLTVNALGITVGVPAPEWIDEGVADTGTASEEGIHSSWYVAQGFDAQASSLDVSIQPLEHWEQGAQRHAYGLDSNRCETLDTPQPERIKGLFEWVVVCGKDYGTLRGVIYYGQARQAKKGVAVDVWYETEVEPFYANDKTAWPMSEADLLAMIDRLRAAITVSVE